MLFTSSIVAFWIACTLHLSSLKASVKALSSLALPVRNPLEWNASWLKMITSAGFSFFSVILSCGNLSLRSSGELKEELPYTMGTAYSWLLLVLGVLYGKVVFELLVVEVLTVRKWRWRWPDVLEIHHQAWNLYVLRTSATLYRVFLLCFRDGTPSFQLINRQHVHESLKERRPYDRCTSEKYAAARNTITAPLFRMHLREKLI